MAIMMLETKQRFVNTDHIVTAYIEGHEDRCQIVLSMVNNDRIQLPKYFKSFAEAEQGLKALAVGMEWLEGV